MINTSTASAGEEWSNRQSNGLFKNLGPEVRNSLPFCQKLKIILSRLCCGHPKPIDGYEKFQQQWHVRCDAMRTIDAARSSGSSSSDNPSEQEVPCAVPDASSSSGCKGGKDLVFWLGHASQMLCLVEGDVNILFDPIFSQRASPLRCMGPKRCFPPPLTVEELPRIDLVLISHNHYDHLDSQTIRAVHQRFPDVRFIVPLQMETLLLPWGIPASSITSLDWWEETEVRVVNSNAAVHLRVACTPAHHYGLHSLFDKNKVLWCGWVVGWKNLDSVGNINAQTGPRILPSPPIASKFIPPSPSDVWDWTGVKTYFFTGDTAFKVPEIFEQIHLHYPRIDMAGLPIGAFSPREMLSFHHIDPESAVEIFKIMNIQQAYGLHWGTFELGGEPIDEPPAVLQETLEREQIRCGGSGEVMDGEEPTFRLIRTGSHLLF